MTPKTQFPYLHTIIIYTSERDSTTQPQISPSHCPTPNHKRSPPLQVFLTPAASLWSCISSERSTLTKHYNLAIIVLMIGQHFFWPLILADLPRTFDRKLLGHFVEDMLEFGKVVIGGLAVLTGEFSEILVEQLAQELTDAWLGVLAAVFDKIKKLLAHWWWSVRKMRIGRCFEIDDGQKDEPYCMNTWSRI
jgi:hypothetical protein